MHEVKFPVGDVQITDGVTAAVSEGVIVHSLQRHQAGDWGEVSAAEKLANDRSLAVAKSIISQYDGGGIRFWIITDRHRRRTTVFLPCEQS